MGGIGSKWDWGKGKGGSFSEGLRYDEKLLILVATSDLDCCFVVWERCDFRIRASGRGLVLSWKGRDASLKFERKVRCAISLIVGFWKIRNGVEGCFLRGR